MGITVDEIVTGRKTFFILPDTWLMPEACLADYFEHNEDKYELLYKEESPRYLAQVSFYKRLK